MLYKKKKKVFFNDQCKDIEESNGMGKTRDLFKKFGGINEAFHSCMDMTKDRNSMDLTEAEEIKKRWQNTQNNDTEKFIMTGITMMV